MTAERGWLSCILQQSLQINFETDAVVEVVLLLAFSSSLFHPCDLRIILQNNKKRKDTNFSHRSASPCGHRNGCVGTRTWGAQAGQDEVGPWNNRVANAWQMDLPKGTGQTMAGLVTSACSSVRSLKTNKDFLCGWCRHRWSWWIYSWDLVTDAHSRTPLLCCGHHLALSVGWTIAWLRCVGKEYGAFIGAGFLDSKHTRSHVWKLNTRNTRLFIEREAEHRKAQFA